jgi:hypothetical protein
MHSEQILTDQPAGAAVDDAMCAGEPKPICHASTGPFSLRIHSMTKELRIVGEFSGKSYEVGVQPLLWVADEGED